MPGRLTDDVTQTGESMQGAAQVEDSVQETQPAMEASTDSVIARRVNALQHKSREGELRDIELYEFVERVSKALDQGSGISAHTVAKVLVLVQSIRINLPSLQAKYTTYVERISIKLAYALRTAGSDEMFADPFAKRGRDERRDETPRTMTAKKLADRFYRDLLRCGFAEAAGQFI